MTGNSVRFALLAAVVVTAAVGGGVAVLVGSSGVASAGHGEADANYTVEPQAPADRKPGATNVQYGQIVVAQAGVDFETLERMRAVYDEGSWANCGSGDAETFGIDRGNTHPGYQTDESLQDNVKRFSAGENVFEVDFHGEDDIGASTHLNDGDAIVSLATCMDNPEEPGWYQITGSATGVTKNGETVTIESESHYFWICDCQNEQEARQQLGPPPSEGGATGTESGGSGGGQTATPSGGDSGNGTGSGGDGNAATSTAGANSGNDTGTDEGAGTAGAAGEGASTDAAGPGGGSGAAGGNSSGGDQSSRDAAVQTENGSDDGWDDHQVETPTDGSGPGFGPGVAVVAVLAAVTILCWRH